MEERQPSNTPPGSIHIPSVSEITGDIKNVLESNFNDVLVQGEISQPRTSANGHTYFTLKDSGAQLPCVLWRNTANRLEVEPEHGQEVVLGGNIEVYPPHGRYQLIVSYIRLSGAGALQVAFERLKNKLQSEGLFDADHKKSLPPFPETIGVITSETGAAFQDIRSTIEKRYPLVTILLYHASVQGNNAAPEIAKGLEYFTKQKNADVLIIGRGGGSLEELWAFNEEIVARAIYACPIPVISAVGHETDFSIADFTADARAATPTQAAILAVPDINELRFYIEDQSKRVGTIAAERVARRREKVERLIRAYGLKAVHQKVGGGRDKIAFLTQRLGQQLEITLLRNKELLERSYHRLIRLNPVEPLERGFVRVLQDEKWKRSKSEFHPKEAFRLEWKDGESDINPV